LIEITEKEGAVIFGVRVVPRASRTQIAGELDGAVKVRVAAPPVEGAANDELIRFFAKVLNVNRSNVEIVSGPASRSKVLRVTNITAAELKAAIGL
jgi:uncharacterized protein